MQKVVDLSIVKDNLKSGISKKLFNWIDIRNDFNYLGIDSLKYILNFDNIGLFTDKIKDAISIRNYNKTVPIIVSKIDRTEQIYDIIINNLILSVDNLDQISEINSLNPKDKLSIVILIKSDHYEEGLSLKKFEKLKELIKLANFYSINGIYTYVNNQKTKNLENFNSIVDQDKYSSFCIGSDEEFTSDGFIDKSLNSNAISIFTPVIRAYKLEGNTCFGGKKIKKDSYGIKIKAPNFNADKHNFLSIEGQKWKIVNYFDNCLYLIGNNSLKPGKKIDVTNFYLDSLINYQRLYQLNGKTIDE